jgi:hypothetical protein
VLGNHASGDDGFREQVIDFQSEVIIMLKLKSTICLFPFIVPFFHYPPNTSRILLTKTSLSNSFARLSHASGIPNDVHPGDRILVKRPDISDQGQENGPLPEWDQGKIEIPLIINKTRRSMAIVNVLSLPVIPDG